MNQIQEMDWAEECWHGHTGMDSTNDYCIVDEKEKHEVPTEFVLKTNDPVGT